MDELCIGLIWMLIFFFFKQKTAYEMRISDWSSDVCSSDLILLPLAFIALTAPRKFHPNPLHHRLAFAAWSKESNLCLCQNRMTNYLRQQLASRKVCWICNFMGHVIASLLTKVYCLTNRGDCQESSFESLK